MSPFEPKGEQARWRILYHLLKGVPVGGVLTYATMAQALDLDENDASDRQNIRVAVRRAAEEFGEKDNHAIEAVRGVGYRVADVSEHLRIARHHGRKAGTQLEIAFSVATNVNLSEVDPEIRKAFEVLAQGFSHQMEINRRQEAKNRRTQRALENVTTKADRTAEEVTEIQKRLDEIAAAVGVTKVEAETRLRAPRRRAGERDKKPA